MAASGLGPLQKLSATISLFVLRQDTNACCVHHPHSLLHSPYSHATHVYVGNGIQVHSDSTYHSSHIHLHSAQLSCVPLTHDADVGSVHFQVHALLHCISGCLQHVTNQLTATVSALHPDQELASHTAHASLQAVFDPHIASQLDHANKEEPNCPPNSAHTLVQHESQPQ
jgi:hypothetical protein